MQQNTFKPLPTSVNFAKLEEQTIKFWNDNDIFKKSENCHQEKKYFVFYDGPPGTNGKPHIGHIMQSALKDLWPRFKSMQGFTVLRKAGWDTHGLPVELTAEKELGLSGKVDINKYGVENFINYCRDTVLRYRSDWVKTISRLGRFIDFDNDYLTMSNDFIQTDWWGIKVAFDKGLLYEDFKIVPYCARCGTGLSNHEVAQGYKDITDLTITATFPLKNDPKTAILAWTTTPWTLLGNVALAVNAELTYVKVATKDGAFILAEDLLPTMKDQLGEYEIVQRLTGQELEGLEYLPLWDFTKLVDDGDKKSVHKIVCDSYVTAADGTGIVHLALYGDDDFRLIKKFGLQQNQHVGPDGKIADRCGKYRGRFFKEEGLDVDIVKDLASMGRLFHKYRYEHSYPHCWRCATPLMYFAKASWFIQTTAFKDLMVAENDRITWHPDHLRKGRFGNWLENNVDWAVSRDRYWGSPMPIWANSEDPKDQICISSLKMLQDLGATMESTGKPVASDLDLHIPKIDDVIIKKEGKIYRRVSGVLDCWYNAGIMPWGQFGFPHTDGSAAIMENQFPADFICEAIDQTRGWFYTLLACSCLVADRTSFKNVICTELILDSKGKKMSKSLGNVIDPLPLIDIHGADSVRWTFYETDPWTVKRYSEELPKEAARSVFIPIWNCLSFFTTYAALDNWNPVNNFRVSKEEIDRWILSELRTTIDEVTKSLEGYDVASATASIKSFIDGLSNWYIRRSRKRFWKSENDEDKLGAYSTLYTVLTTLSKLIAPLAPFISEQIHQELVRPFYPKAPESVHLDSWPDLNLFIHEKNLEEEIGVIQEAASLVRSLRVDHNLRVRQPLSSLIVVTPDSGLATRLSKHLSSLAEEINVKNITIASSAQEYVDLIIKPNWKLLGPRFGANMKAANVVINGLSNDQRVELLNSKSIEISVEGNSYKLEPLEVSIEQKAREGMVAAAGRRVSVVLTIELNDALLAEGYARDLISIIQRERKAKNFKVNDHISAIVVGGKEVELALLAHRDMVSRECLADRIEYRKVPIEGLEKFIVGEAGCQLLLEVI